DPIEPGREGHSPPLKSVNILQRTMKSFGDNVLCLSLVAQPVQGIAIDRVHVAFVQGAKGDRARTRRLHQLALSFQLLGRGWQRYALHAECRTGTLQVQCIWPRLDTGTRG